MLTKPFLIAPKRDHDNVKRDHDNVTVSKSFEKLIFLFNWTSFFALVSIRQNSFWSNPSRAQILPFDELCLDAKFLPACLFFFSLLWVVWTGFCRHETPLFRHSWVQRSFFGLPFEGRGSSKGEILIQVEQIWVWFRRLTFSVYRPDLKPSEIAFQI